MEGENVQGDCSKLYLQNVLLHNNIIKIFFKNVISTIKFSLCSIIHKLLPEKLYPGEGMDHPQD